MKDPNRLRAELIEFADKGCLTPFEAECPTQFPDHPNEWCFACLATAVIEWHHEELERRLLAAALGAPPPADSPPSPKEQHLMDVYQALGVRWGDDPFVVIAMLKAAALPAQLRSSVLGVLKAYGHDELAAEIERTGLKRSDVQTLTAIWNYPGVRAHIGTQLHDALREIALSALSSEGAVPAPPPVESDAPCMYAIGLTTCGYGRAAAGHFGSTLPAPPAGRHEYSPAKRDADIAAAFDGAAVPPGAAEARPYFDVFMETIGRAIHDGLVAAEASMTPAERDKVRKFDEILRLVDGGMEPIEAARQVVAPAGPRDEKET